MKGLALAACAVLGAWFWSSAPDPSPHAWPRGMPEFAHGEILYSTRRSDGGAAFVSFLSPQEPRDVLASARSAFLAAGWSVSPVGTADMLLFEKDAAVAAVLARRADGLRTRVAAAMRR